MRSISSGELRTVTPPTWLFLAAGRGLVWSEDVEMTYTNWETHDVAFSVLSPNSCFWIQSNTGLWKPGSCRNRTHGVICKQPRSECGQCNNTIKI